MLNLFLQSFGSVFLDSRSILSFTQKRFFYLKGLPQVEFRLRRPFESCFIWRIFYKAREEYSWSVLNEERIRKLMSENVQSTIKSSWQPQGMCCPQQKALSTYHIFIVWIDRWDFSFLGTTLWDFSFTLLLHFIPHIDHNPRVYRRV